MHSRVFDNVSIARSGGGVRARYRSARERRCRPAVIPLTLAVLCLPFAASGAAAQSAKPDPLAEGPLKPVKVVKPVAAVPECSLWDKYNTKGSESPVTTNCETVFPELGGLRKTLIENGFNFQGVMIGNYTYDVLNHREARQYYNGQDPSAFGAGYAILTYDLGRLGLNPGSQITFEPSFSSNTFSGAGINAAYVGQLSAYLPFFNDRFSVQFGYYNIASQFYGAVIGTNVGASALGPQSSILFEVGAQPLTSIPAIDIRLYSPDKSFYSHFGVFRSVSPRGGFVDADENPSGLSFSVPGGKAAYIEEVGYRIEASPDTRKVWIRAGGIYNTSEYTLLNNPTRTATNHAFYAVADFQLTKSDPSIPALGWYVNLKYDYGREDVNFFASDYGVTLYKFGTFATRPGDVFSVAVSRNIYSRDALTAARMNGLDPATAAMTYSASYAYRVQRGIYLQSALTYTDNPTFTPRRPGSLNFSATLAMLF